MKSRNFVAASAAFSGAGLTLPLSAEAHHAMGGALPNDAMQGLLSGLAHPVIGLDHLLFVIAVGAACYYFRNRTATMITFLLGTVLGTVLHLQKATIPYPDLWVALTLMVLGVLCFRASDLLKSKTGWMLFLICGVAHGYAYGESIVGAESTPLFAYLAGFTLVQLTIICCAYAVARYVDVKWRRLQTLKVASGVLSIAGAAFAVLAIV